MSTAFTHRVRIYWEDTDAGGIVFYANYLRFFERARTEWLRRAGWGQQALLDEWGIVFVVAEAHLRYLAPARIDDELEVSVALLAPPRVGVRLLQQARRGDQILVEARITMACVEAATLRPCRIPPALLSALE